MRLISVSEQFGCRVGRLPSVVAVVGMSVCLTQVCPAQSSGSAASDTAEDSSVLGEVVVTAQKRSENMQDVPIAVSAVSSVQLEKAGITDIVSLRLLVPSLNTTNTEGRLTMSLRGIGTVGVGPGVDNPVALYVDGVYYGSSVASLLSLNNIQQIEVLKGPQGTLFGRNATGGLVQITTKDPTSAPSGAIDLSYANYSTSIAKAYFSAGVGDSLAGDFAGYIKHQADGWGNALLTGEQTYSVDRDIAVRSKWVYKPADETRITLIGDYSNTLDNSIPLTMVPGTRLPNFPGYVGYVQPDIGYDSNANYLPEHTVVSGGATLRWDQDISGARLSTISAYRADRVFIGGDQDGTSANIQNYFFTQHDHQFSQEIQLTSAPGRLEWTTGLYYYGATTTAPAGVVIPPAGINVLLTGLEKIRTEAVYGQATYAIEPATRLTLGGRFTSEQRQAIDEGTAVVPIGIGPSVPSFALIPNAKSTFNKFTYRASLDHRLSDDLLAYISANSGFKSGGYNIFSPGSPAYKPESLNAYEIGIKSDLLDRRVRLNVAAFDYEYKDIQVAKYVDNGYNTTNGAGARSYGVDADLTVAVTSDVRLTAGGVLIHPKFTEYNGCAAGVPGGGVPPVDGNCAGKLLPLASEASGSIALDYTLRIPGGDVDFNGSAYYNSGFYFEPDNLIHQASFVEFSASGRWTRADGHIYVGLFGKNLSNKRVMTFGSTQGLGTQVLLWAEPRVYGVEVGAKF